MKNVKNRVFIKFTQKFTLILILFKKKFGSFGF